MSDQTELLAEAYRRGLLPPDRAAAYREAMSRGLVPKIGAPEVRNANARPADNMVVSAAKGAAEGFGRTVLGAQQLVGKGLEAVGAKGAGEWLVSDAEKGIDKLSAETAADRAAHPIVTGAGEIGGSLALPGGAVSKLVGGGIKGAAAAGALAGAMQPVEHGDNYLASKVAQVGTGAAGGAVMGAVAPHIAASVGKVAKWAVGVRGPQVADDPAAKAVLQRIAKDARAGGPTAQDMLDLLTPAQQKGVPLAPIDVGGEGMKALAGKVARSGGEARQIITRFLDSRDAGAGQRVNALVDQHIAPGSVRQTAAALADARSTAARPLWDKAMAGGSLVPLRTQLEKQMLALGEREAAANKLIAKSQGYLGRLKKTDRSAKLFHQANIDTATKDLKAIAEERAAASELLAKARADGTANAPGAVWSPRLQQFMNEPVIQAGIQRGLKIERQTALAEGRKMNPTDYAIVGKDANGDPVVGTVPTMRLLQTAKEGIDRAMEDPQMRDPLTKRLTKDGIAMDKVRRAFLDELDNLNPDYKAAREQWSGATKSMEALRDGRDIFKMHPEEIAQHFRGLAANDREFYRLGVADVVKERINKTGLGGDEAKAVLRNQHVKMQLRPIFESDEAYQKFVDSITHEQTMFGTRFHVLGGSQTAMRVAEDGTPMTEAAMHAAHGVDAATSGRLLSALGHGLRAMKSAGKRTDPKLNAAIARIITSTGPGPANDFLRRAAAMPQTRNHLAAAIRKASPLIGAGTAQQMRDQ